MGLGARKPRPGACAGDVLVGTKRTRRARRSRRAARGARSVRRCLVTGAAGFIGSHLCEALLARGERVVGVDCFSDYYDPAQKRANLGTALAAGLQFRRLDLTRDALDIALKDVDVVCHLAAQPGVRPSW